MNIQETWYVDMQSIQQRKVAQTIWENETSILLYDTASEIYLAAAKEESETHHIWQLMQNKSDSIILRGMPLQTVFDKDETYIKEDSYYFAQCMETIPYDLSSYPIDIRPLEFHECPMVCEHYSFQELANEAYVNERIQEGMLGAFLQDTCVGFIGTHDSGSIGMLEVFPAYRHHHYGEALIKAMVNQQLQKGTICYGEVFFHNQASLSLLHKLNFTFSKDMVHWYCKKV